ncbi:hypothetical protein FXO38_33282 [Capsicum annuum]|nr:hypothetical protein FXO38_33282 [Capsicum annuum]
MLSSIINVYQESLNWLKILKLKACVNYFLADKRPHNAPKIMEDLEELHLSLMGSLQYIYYGPSGFASTYSFKKLRIVKAEHCRSMITLVTHPLVEKFPILEEVHVAWCNELRQIFSLHNFTEDKQGIISTGLGPRNRLAYNEGMRGRSNHLSPRFSYRGSWKYKEEDCHDILLSKLRRISLNYLPKLQHIWNVIKPLPSTSHHKQVRLDNLTIIEIKGCLELKSIFPSSLSEEMRQIEVLKVVECPKMESIVSKASSVEIPVDCPTFPRLRVVNVEYCLKISNLFRFRQLKVYCN